MALSKGWGPSSRESILVMEKAWLLVLAANVQKWRIPENIVQMLSAAIPDTKRCYFFSPRLTRVIRYGTAWLGKGKRRLGRRIYANHFSR